MKNWVTGIAVVLLIMLSGLFFGLYYMRIDWLQFIMVLFIIYGAFMLSIDPDVKNNKPDEDKSYRPFISIIVPARNEEYVIAKTIKSLMNLDYKNDNKPNFEVIVMDDNSSDKTFEEATSLMDSFPNLRVIHRDASIAGRGKSDVLNHGLRLAKGEVIGVFDADTEVEPDFIEKSIHLLAQPDTGGVQGRVRMYNRDKNILTSLQDDEFAVVSHLYQQGKDYIGGVTALGGNGQFVKREALDAVDGWNYMSPTEDLDLTFKLLFKGWNVRYAPQSVLWQEGVEKFYPFIRQRIRWAEGFLKCIFDYLPLLLSGKHSLIKKIDGVMTMGRILIPFYVWIIYICALTSVVSGVTISYKAASILVALSSWLFFGSLISGMRKVMYPDFLTAVYKTVRYAFYGIFWAIAIPLGFINCAKHINDIKWDKTMHIGESVGNNKRKTLKTGYSGAGINSR
jgi:1,2-diacylglycerol 3-beta-glucosyltransferase